MIPKVEIKLFIVYNEVTTAEVAERENVSAATSGQYTCNQTHEKGYNKNCSTLFSASSLEDAAAQCKKSESEGGQGCCRSAKIFTNLYGAISRYEVVPAGTKKGEGSFYSCN